jgi:uncharacterized protein YdeI (YjbR/CyaY-like superfamily)
MIRDPRASKPVFFRSAADLRAWFARNHATAEELWLGYHKKATGRPSVDWPQSVDEALCVGWIDGIRNRIDDETYVIRFTPRRPRSVWSTVNVKRVAALTRARRMRAAGRKAFEARRENRSGIYSYEQRRERLEEPFDSALRENPEAAAFFDAQPASYRRMASWWVVSAKKEETRWKRLRGLVDHSASGRRLPQFTRREPSSRTK